MNSFHFPLSKEQKKRFSRQPDQIVGFNIIFRGNYEISQYLSETPFRFWLNTQPENYPTHWHSAMELIMPFENSYTLNTANHNFYLNPGDILFIPPGILHSITAPVSGNRFIFQFETEPLTKIQGFSHIQNLFNTPQLFTPDTIPELYANSRNTVMELAEHYWTESPSKELRIYSTLLRFFSDYNDYYHQKLAEKAGSEIFTPNPAHKRAITYVLTYISEHYMEDLSLENMASMIGFSKFHFSRLFKIYTRQTFYNYLYQYRIRIAQNLLCHPTMSITEISMRTGFNSSSAFSRAFKQWTSYTPTEYRKMFHLG